MINSIPQLGAKINGARVFPNYIRVVVFDDNSLLGKSYEIHPWTANPLIPVLYFTFMVSDNGIERIASTDEVIKAVDPSVQKYITVAEHPLTSLRTHILHPCNTLDFLNDTGGDWWLWVQCFGPLVGLNVHK